MRPADAIIQLEDLKAQAGRAPQELEHGGRDAAWKGKVEAVISRSLGADHQTLIAFRKIKYTLGFWTDSTTRDHWTQAFVRGVQNGCGVIDAAIFELELLTEDDAPIDDRAFDPELWAHVKTIVADEDWGKVASLVSTFVEDRVRVWSGHPKDNKNGEDLYGKGLYAYVFADDSEYRLGSRRGEWEGWRMLGIGFAQAISNVDRHHVLDRADLARRYALGVLGLGSLLLTQMRFEHAALLSDGQ